MKKVLFVLAIAVALTFVMTATAFADHSPTFFVEWDGATSFSGYSGTTFGNAGTGGPHSNYLEGTEKCGVCHSVHRAPWGPGIAWWTAGQSGGALNPESTGRIEVAGGQYDRQDFITSDGQGQMLLQGSVAMACDYCHILTSTGGIQLFAGSTALRTGVWQSGFAHSNACTGCHAVHGVASNYGEPAKYGATGVFQGAALPWVLKVRAKGSGGAPGNVAAYNWQDECIAIGSQGKALLAASTIPGMPAWAAAQTPQDYAGINNPPDVIAVDPLNVPLFPSMLDCINGTNVRPDADAAQAQASAFCTFCHTNYGWASEATVNPDGDRSLFQGTWYALAGTVPNVQGAAGMWTTMNGAGGYQAPFRNHPVKPVDGAFVAAGKSATVPSQVAFADSGTCVDCHDAGVRGVSGVIVESYPHFTPGYFHFVKGAAHVGAGDAYGPVELGLIQNYYAFSDTAGIAAAQAWLADVNNYHEATTVHDGECLKCHVNATDDAGVGKTY